MGLLPLENLQDDLRCPRCRCAVSADAGWYCTNSSCTYSSGFSAASSVPVFIDFERSIIPKEAFAGDRPAQWGGSGANPLKKTLVKMVSALNGTNAVARRSAERIRALLQSQPRKRVLVVGGASIGNGAESLYASEDVDLIAFDIVASQWTQFIADAHAVPLADGSVDAVWIQAVLEHVLEPWTVVAEIERVLSPGGLVYADTPFLQQVHLGAYDFTRFTESGHRWLFRNFERLDSGVVWGPGTQLAWSLDYAARSVFRSSKAGRLVRLAALPFAFLIDRLSAKNYAVDTASAVYFMGRKSPTGLLPRDMTAAYQGAQRGAQVH